MSEGRRLPAVAIGMAVLAVVLSGIATIVVIARDPSAAAATERGPSITAQAAHQIEATDLVEMERSGVEAASKNGAVIGVKVTDPGLRASLGVEPDDVITAISGRPIRRQFDIHDVIAGASLMNTSALFVELMRGDTPVLVRWDLAGDLRTARRGPSRRGALGFPSTPTPVRPVRDPLIDTITATDDHHITAPRATIEQVATSPSTYGQGVRVMRSSRPAGVRIYFVRPTSVLYALGLRSMDTVTVVNGVTVDDPGKLAEVYEQVKSAATLRIEIERRGTTEVIEITQTP